MTKKKHNRLAPDVRKRQIIDAGLEMVRADGYQGLTVRGLARKIGIANSSVLHHYPTLLQLRRAVMRTAIAREDLLVVGMGLAAGDKYALAAPAHMLNPARDALKEAQPWTDQ
ncbi:putative TetR transcriptional regulator [Vibrio phage CKB-S1]|nr:putative TetR transcriptional regulator [Vibrio phage CKB-S1]